MHPRFVRNTKTPVTAFRSSRTRDRYGATDCRLVGSVVGGVVGSVGGGLEPDEVAKLAEAFG
jgi:hypothetical protein